MNTQQPPQVEVYFNAGLTYRVAAVVMTPTVDEICQLQKTSPLSATILSRLLVGAEPIRATAVERRDHVDWTMLGILEFPGDFLAQFECSIENHERHEAEITGTEGTIRFPDPWFPGTESACWHLVQGERQQAFEVPGADPYGLEALDFARAVAAGTPPRWPISDAVAGLAAMDALFEAARSGRTVRVAPA